MAFTRKDFLRTSALASLSSLVLKEASTQSRLSTNNSPIIKPKALQRGDTLGLVAPASPIYDPDDFDKMMVDLMNLGFKLKLGKHVRNQRGYLAGTDKHRAEDLMNMFKDPDVDGVMCVRGGWGCNRTLPHVDFNVIRNNPKVFCGFSDITSLHMAIYKECDLHTFHGPVGASNWNDFTTDAFTRVIMKGQTPTFRIPEDDTDHFIITSGAAKGKLLGGNLTVLTSMIGSKYVPSFKNAVLFIEDVGENIYRIDRMITQLKLAGILDEISGFVFGKCTDCDSGANSLSIQQVLDDHIKPLNIPAFYGAMISHADDNITLPVGIDAEIDADQKTIRILDSGVV
jgi:muramoyltetrapeptide carboxypeptidase